MPRLPERLPAPLSERLASASQAIYSRLGREVDVAVGGIPFMLATSAEVPQSIETIPQRKEQFDSERDPGEQSLAGWWRRSQSSFHHGAGFLYEPNVDDAHNGFWDSSGIDVFTPGQLTLLRRMVNSATSTTINTRAKSYARNSMRTNLCENPSAEANATGWNGSGSLPPTVTRSTTRAWSGVASIRAVWQTAGTLPLVQIAGMAAGTATVGATYTASVYVWVPTGSVDVALVVPGFDTLFGPSNGGLKDQWVRLTHTSTASGTSPIIQIWPVTPPTAGHEVYIDAALFEEGGVAGSYFDGNSPGGAWIGTANNSASTETFVATATSLSRIGDGTLVFQTGTHAPVGKTLVDGVVSGGTFYDVASDGTLYEGLLTSPGTATSWPCGTTPSRLGWGKHRLWIIGGRKLWQPNLALAGGTTQNPIFTHPNQGWTYTCMAEGPGAMYFGGHDGFNSTIQAVTLDAGGGLPTLSGATVTATLPDGELVQELAVLAGQFVGIGTNKGVRVGKVNEDASIIYGPLLVEPEGVTACTALISQGKFFLVAFRTASGSALAYKIDTSTELAEGVYPYAKDIECPLTGAITSMALVDGDMWATTSNGQLWSQLANVYVLSGWIQSSRIRYRTTEPKAYKFLNVEMEPLKGSVTCDLILEGGSTLPLGNITKQNEVFTEPFGIELAPMRYASVKITMLTAGSSNGTGPTVNSFLLRAMPAVAPARLITLPLLCYDQEQARSGQRYGGDGYSQDRLLALQELESEARTLVYQDFTTGLDVGLEVSIESIKFVQLAPRDSGTGNMGGILYLQLRTVGV